MLQGLQQTEMVAPIEWQLTMSEARVISLLLTRDVATKEAILHALYSDRPEEPPEIKIVDVFICKARKKLAPFGIEIETVWGRGYRIPRRADVLEGISTAA